MTHSENGIPEEATRFQRTDKGAVIGPNKRRVITTVTDLSMFDDNPKIRETRKATWANVQRLGE